MARGQEGNPFVLVLIDGDGYIFDDDLISSGAEGGQRAAHLLNQSVKESLRARGLEKCRIMVRVYANLSGLSKTLSKVRLAGPEKRSLSPFVANFNRSNELFDFVDAGELKENADYKIRAMFRLFAENTQCKQIYFAGCHDVGYISELTPYVGNRDRITLVRSTTFHHEFSKLGMRIESFPNTFRLTPLDVFAPESVKALPTRTTESTATTASTSPQICSFYQKGKCTYGKACRNLHLPRVAIDGADTMITNGPDFRDWRQNGLGSHSGKSFQMSSLAKTDNEFLMNGGNPTTNDTSTYPSDNVADVLPRAEDIPAGQVAVNTNQHRLDPYMASVPQEEWSAFNARTARQKLCNNYHLTGICQVGSSCQYDHSPVSPAILKCLQQVARSLPCSRRGACRVSDCTQGHICQKPDCKHRGGKNFCKLPFTVHVQDLRMAELVPGDGPPLLAPERQDHTLSDGKDSTPSLPETGSETLNAVVDSDDEKQDGAPLDVSDTASLD